MGGASARAGIVHPRSRPSPRAHAQYPKWKPVFTFIGASPPRRKCFRDRAWDQKLSIIPGRGSNRHPRADRVSPARLKRGLPKGPGRGAGARRRSSARPWLPARAGRALGPPAPVPPTDLPSARGRGSGRPGESNPHPPPATWPPRGRRRQTSGRAGMRRPPGARASPRSLPPRPRARERLSAPRRRPPPPANPAFGPRPIPNPRDEGRSRRETPDHPLGRRQETASPRHRGPRARRDSARRPDAPRAPRAKPGSTSSRPPPPEGKQKAASRSGSGPDPSDAAYLRGTRGYWRIARTLTRPLVLTPFASARRRFMFMKWTSW